MTTCCLLQGSAPEVVDWYNRRSGGCLAARPASHLHKQKGSHVSQVLLQVSGLKCVSCAARLKGRLLDSLSAQGASCQVDFPAGKVLVTGAALQPAQLIAVVESLGYTAVIVEERTRSLPALQLESKS